MENKGYIKIEDVSYIRLSSCDPVSEQSTYVTHFWKHHDCGGDIFIGDNAHFLCEKCGQMWPVSFSNFMTPTTTSLNDFYISQTKTFTGYHIALGEECIDNLGIDWFVRFCDNVKKQYNRHYFNMKKYL